MKKRVLGLLFVLVMLLGLIPAAIMAASAAVGDTYGYNNIDWGKTENDIIKSMSYTQQSDDTFTAYVTIDLSRVDQQIRDYAVKGIGYYYYDNNNQMHMGSLGGYTYKETEYRFKIASGLLPGKKWAAKVYLSDDVYGDYELRDYSFSLVEMVVPYKAFTSVEAESTGVAVRKGTGTLAPVFPEINVLDAVGKKTTLKLNSEVFVTDFYTKSTFAAADKLKTAPKAGETYYSSIVIVLSDAGLICNPAKLKYDIKIPGYELDVYSVQKVDNGELLEIRYTAEIITVSDKPAAYTFDSKPAAGCTMAVDLEYMASNSDEFMQSYFDGKISITWYIGDHALGGSGDFGEIIKLSSYDIGKTVYAEVNVNNVIYYGEKLKIMEKKEDVTIPEITTKTLPEGAVGESYYQKIGCSNQDVVFSLFRSSLPDGLRLTSDGVIEGVPIKSGDWYVVIMVTPKGGENYSNFVEYEFKITEEIEQYSLEIMQLPNKLVYTAGEKLDMKGLWVRIYTSEGFIDSRDGKYLTYSQKELVTLGEQKIKLTYEDAFEFFIVTVKAAHVHKENLTKVAAKAATCTSNGNIEYYKCSCGKFFTDVSASNEIPNRSGFTIPAGHKYGNLVAEVSATHTATVLKAGMRAHYVCSACKAYFTADKTATTESALVIAAPTHSYTNVNGYKGADGHANTCSCGAYEKIVSHIPNIPAATEAEDQKCTACNYLISPKISHVHKNNLTKVDAKPATCTVDGNTEYYNCSCGRVFADSDASIEITYMELLTVKAGHSYGALVAEIPATHTATELKAGMKAHYVCSDCKAYFTAEKTATTEEALVIAAPAHSFTTVNGYKGADGHANTCSCGAHDAVVAHIPGAPATETSEQKCTACDYVLAEKLVPAETTASVQTEESTAVVTDTPVVTDAPDTTEEEVATTEAPEITEAPAPAVTDYPTQSTPEEPNKGGCSSSIAAGCIVLVAILGTAIVFKKN